MSNPVTTRWTAINDSGFDAWLALPPAGSGPGLVLWQEIFGVNDHIRCVADQLALAGFVVLAPDVFWRQTPRVELDYVGDDRARGIALMTALKADELQADVLASVAALRALPETSGRKLGSIGYCLGGRLAYSTAALTDITAAVAYYGGGIHNHLALAAGIRGAVQFHYAEVDDNIPLDAVERVRAAMAGKDSELHVYAGAHHGFNCWARASYDAPSAALALGRSLTFLAQRLF